MVQHLIAVIWSILCYKAECDAKFTGEDNSSEVSLEFLTHRPTTLRAGVEHISG